MKKTVLFLALPLVLVAMVLQRGPIDAPPGSVSPEAAPVPAAAADSAVVSEAPAEALDVDGAPAEAAQGPTRRPTARSHLLVERVDNLLPPGFVAVRDEEWAVTEDGGASVVAASFAHADRGIRVEILRSRMEPAAIANLIAASVGTREAWEGTSFATVHESRRGDLQLLVVAEGGLMTNVRISATSGDRMQDMSIDDARALVQSIVASPFD